MNFVELGSVCQLINGRAFKPSEWSDSGTPIIRIQNLNDKDKSFNYCNFDVDEKFHVNSGDLLFSWSGTPGTSFGAFFWHRGFAYLNQHIFKVIVDSNKVTKEYFQYAVNSKLQHIIDQAHGGVGLKHITKGKLEATEILLPPLETQKQIAAVLDKAEALKQKRQQALALADEYLRATFLDLFGDPITNPKGWPVRELKSLSSHILNGTTPKGGKENYVSEGITFLRSQNVWKREVRLDDVAYIEQNTHDGMAKSSLKHKDILMTKTGRFNTENSSLGRAAIYEGEDDKANINGHVYLIRLTDEVVNEFVLFILTTNEYRNHIRNVCVGGIDKRQLNKNHIEEFPIIYPPIELQEKFKTIYEKVEALKAKMQASQTDIEQLAKSLSQKAFRGELVK